MRNGCKKLSKKTQHLATPIDALLPKKLSTIDQQIATKCRPGKGQRGGQGKEQARLQFGSTAARVKDKRNERVGSLAEKNG